MRKQLQKYVNKSIRISRAVVSNFGLKTDRRVKLFNKELVVPTILFSSLYIGCGTEVDHAWVILDPDIFNRLGDIKLGTVLGFTARIRYYDKKLAIGTTNIDIGIDSICGRISTIYEGDGTSLYKYLKVIRKDKKVFLPDYCMKKIFSKSKKTISTEEEKNYAGSKKE